MDTSTDNTDTVGLLRRRLLELARRQDEMAAVAAAATPYDRTPWGGGL